MEACHDNLAAGMVELGLLAEDDKINKMLAFITLIEKWNKAYNLTAIRAKADMVGLHLLDSLAVAPYVQGARIADIGTGAGLPGIPLAIYQPEKAFVLLDSNTKKTRFVQQVILELGLKNVEVYHTRVEDYQTDLPFDTLITRAFAGLWDIVVLTSHLLAEDGLMLAMKGQAASVDFSGINANCTVIPLSVPGVAAERCLAKIDSLAKNEKILWEK
ncbi:MAG: 16S rRNA (guanine(527)-N(7))-methyltransferase RsmG [Methylococcaceae bacterium]|jgi:16S rRNA (guanine527-N7)-methyltransferase